MKHGLLLLASGGVLILAGPALAHHSGAMFDRSKTLTITGVIKNFSYTQPHGWIDILVPDPAGGPATQWSIECGAPPAMRNLGVTPAVLKPGVKIVARLHPLKDGRPSGSFIDVTIDGKSLGAARPPQAPATPPPATPRS